VAAYNACAAVHDLLCKPEHKHNDVERVRQDIHGAERFENPLEDIERVKILHIVFLNHHMDEFVTEDERQYHSGYWYYDCFGQGANK